MDGGGIMEWKLLEPIRLGGIAMPGGGGGRPCGGRPGGGIDMLGINMPPIWSSCGGGGIDLLDFHAFSNSFGIG